MNNTLDKTMVRYKDAFAAGVCGTGSRAQIAAVGLDWRHFVITGYSARELYDAFGEDHPVVNRVLRHMIVREALDGHG